MALYGPQGVGFDVFARNKPRRMVTGTARLPFCFEPPNTQTLALPQRVKAQAHMLSDGSAGVVFDRAGCLGNVAIQKLAEWTFADKANSAGVFFLGIWQTNVLCNLPYLSLVQLANWEHRFGQLCLIEAV